ncbi:glycosyltransferase family 87 protein [Micrococcus sp.]|uniref:glycosyltransferase family 87 protein n=1 Tax=Micrococcus sp. TaxID=1271 RepID=UPI002A91A8FA|nr:glycosyltransferase 87 family protein [Micrococcus sp.]MDY6054392.1 glycosyltransferase 87 family protein [Micrococcus sp.]
MPARPERTAPPALRPGSPSPPTLRPSGRLLGLLLAVTALAALAALLSKQWCRLNGWVEPGMHVHMCYSDFAQLFPTRGLADGHFPFFTPLPEEQWMEYPALLAVVAGVTAWFVPDTGSLHERTVQYFDVNALGVVLCWAVLVVATAHTARARARDALLVALAPTVILTSMLNWDLWAVMLAGLALWAWSAERPVLAGALLGLGTATKLYPLFFFGALLVLALRTGRWREFGGALAAGAVAWAAVNVPFMLTAFDQWSRFYTFSGEREVSFSSVWLALHWTGWSGATFSLLSNGLFALCCAGVLWLGLAAPVRPRLAQLCMLIVASFLLLGKVYSPQFVMWLVPLVVLANPRPRQFWIWQAAEVLHWAGLWVSLSRATAGEGFGPVWVQAWYVLGIAVHMAALIWVCVTVIRDILDPSRDPVRRTALTHGGQVAPGVGEDPNAGVFAGVEDRLVLRTR